MNFQQRPITMMLVLLGVFSVTPDLAVAQQIQNR